MHIDMSHVLGLGEHTIHDLINQEGNPELKVWWVLFLIVILKCFATGFTLMAGGSAGFLVPSMIIGGVSGAGIFYLLSDLGVDFMVTKDINLFIVSGIAASLVAVVQVPISAILIVTEIFGSNFAPPAMISVVICHFVVKRVKGYEKYKIIMTSDQSLK